MAREMQPLHTAHHRCSCRQTAQGPRTATGSAQQARSCRGRCSRTDRPCWLLLLHRRCALSASQSPPHSCAPQGTRQRACSVAPMRHQLQQHLNGLHARLERLVRPGVDENAKGKGHSKRHCGRQCTAKANTKHKHRLKTRPAVPILTAARRSAV